MEFTKRALIILGIIGLIITGIVLIYNPKEIKKDLIFEKNNLIVNQTENKSLDTIIHVGLNELELTDLIIVVRDMPISYVFDGPANLSLQAFITYSDDEYYTIYIRKFRLPTNIKIIAHELIHLSQYHEKRISLKNPKYVIWEKDTLYVPLKFEYNNRPWEIEASKEEIPLKKKIEETLFR